MIKGLRNEYLESIGGQHREGELTNVIRRVYSDMSSDIARWSQLWKTIYRLIHPTLDSIYISSDTGTIEGNRIYSSTPAILFNDLADFYLATGFPEHNPWIRSVARTNTGIPVDKSNIDTETLRFADTVVQTMRFFLVEGGFYEDFRSFLTEDLLLGNAAMQAIADNDKITFKSIPISRLAVGRSSDGRVHSIGEIFGLYDWEVVKNYGPGGLLLFDRNNPRPENYAQNGAFSRQGFGVAGQSAMQPWNNFLTDQANGANDEYMGNKRVKKILKFYTPNNGFTGIPHNPSFHPDYEYLCFNVTLQTGRLLDVEVCPALPFSVSRANVTAGENYGRGLGGLLLPDISVLNKKKQIELRADNLISQSPILETGQVERPPGQQLRPFQVLKGRQGSDIKPIFDRSRASITAHNSYDSELNALGVGVRRDRTELPPPQSRRTAMEFTQTLDGQMRPFAPEAARYHRQGAQPMLDYLLTWLYITEKLPPIPAQILGTDIHLSFEPVSAFTYGQESEIGQNVQRAFGPVAPLLENDPRPLRVFNSEKFLRSNLSRYELNEFVRSRAEVEAEEKKEMAMLQLQAQAKGGGGGTSPSEQVANERETAALESGAGENYTTV